MMSWPNEPMIHVALRNQLPIILFYQKCKQHIEITVVGCRTGSDPNQRYPHHPYSRWVNRWCFSLVTFRHIPEWEPLPLTKKQIQATKGWKSLFRSLGIIFGYLYPVVISWSFSQQLYNPVDWFPTNTAPQLSPQQRRPWKKRKLHAFWDPRKAAPKQPGSPSSSWRSPSRGYGIIQND